MHLRALQHAWVLAAVLLVGGVMAPGVHRVQHAQHASEARAALHAEVGHVHTAHDAFSVALPVYVHHDVVCVLCSTWTEGTLLPAGTLAPARHVFGLLADVPAAPATRGTRARSIRGPPVRF